jgi:hypothetical protein
MKRVFALCVLVSSALLTTVHATNNPDYQNATVVSVESNSAAPVEAATSDAPLRADLYTYNIGIRLGNVVYQATYNSAFADVSPVFATSQPLQVDMQHNMMYVALPGNRMIPMAIENRTVAGNN